VDEVTANAIRVLSDHAATQPATPTSSGLLIDPVTSISVVTAFNGKFESQGFEGNEKRLEIDLIPDSTVGPLKLSRQFWDDVLDLVSAKILDYKSNGVMEGYILSESSLFVSAHRVTLITCGTTVLLNCLQTLLEGIRGLGREVEYIQYSRKNFTFPWQQPAPHRSIAAEYSILTQFAPSGSPYILGPLDRDHYFMYVMDNITRPAREETDMQLNMLMYDIGEEVASHFYSEVDSANDDVTAKIREKTGLTKLFDSQEVVQDQV
jgi:S-adenosylmethionine decarboxylase